MAEAIAVVGLVSAIVQFIDFGRIVLNRLNEFNHDTKDVPKTFSDIKTRLPLLIDTLGRIKKQADSGYLSKATADSLRPLVDGCLEQATQLNDVLDRILPAKETTNWQRRIQVLKSLAHDKPIQQINSTLDGFIQSLTFHQTTTTVDLSINLLGREVTPFSRVGLSTSTPKPIFMVPFAQDKNFIGRSDVLINISINLNGPERRAALAGIGGVGKSQIAIEYCYRFRTEQPNAHVFWIHSGNLARFHQAYEEIARRLGLHEGPNTDTLQRVSEWLSDEDKGQWLLVLDNADDQDVLFSRRVQGSSKALVDYLPRSSNGSILITTRDKRVGQRLTSKDHLIVVSSFETEDARQLLRNKLPKEAECDEGEIKELFETLHYLPLAITQAAAYINEEGVSLQDYLGYLRDDLDTKVLFQQDYYDAMRDSETQNSIFLTWKISFEQINRQKPRAAELLSLMAVLDRQSIPEDLLCEAHESKVAYHTAIGNLKAFSLIVEQSGGKVFGLHRLVQLSMRLWLEEHQSLLEWQAKAFDAVSRCCPSNESYETWSSWETLSPHIKIVMGYNLATEPYLLGRASILTHAALYDVRRGKYRYGRQKSEEALVIRKKLLGEEHLDTLESINCLAVVLARQGKYNNAEEMSRHVLRFRERTLGKEHPKTLTSMHNLATGLGDRGDYYEAEEMHRRVLDLRGNVLGEKHPDTLVSMNQLASTLETQEKYDEAEGMRQQVVALQEEVLGESHPDTLASMSNFGKLLTCQGHHNRAEEIHRRVLVLSEEVLGKEHPNTLTSMMHVAAMLEHQEKYQQAEDLCRRILKLREEVLGKEHPATLNCEKLLARILESRNCKEGKD